MIETCKKYDLMTIKFNGFTSFGNWLFGKRVLAVKIEPSHNLELLRAEMINEISDFCQLSKFDTEKWKPHATIALKEIDKKFGLIKAYLENRSCPEIQHYVFRITLLKNARILREHDFLQRRVLTRNEVLNREIKRLTIRLLREKKEEMLMVYERRRGTAIVKFPEGILVVSLGSKSFMLAGGGANKGESRRKAAMRELQEETGLKPLSSKYLFSYKGRLHKNFRERTF
jgi:hypothetical protein